MKKIQIPIQIEDEMGISIRALKESDIPGLNKLPPSNWNIDYEGFLKDFIKDGFFYPFVMLKDSKIIGTGNVLIQDKIGWLAHIIVSEEFRGHGLGTYMTKFLVAFLKEKDCETQILIATELGEAVYNKIGFIKTTDYYGFDSEIDETFVFTKSIRKLKQADLEHICKLDSLANAEDRTHLIVKYYESGFGYFNADAQLLGFYIPDFGKGLIISKDKDAGIELLKLKHSKKGKRTLLPVENIEACNFLEESDLKKTVKYSRMVLGKINKWNPTYIYSYGSGYCG